MALVAHERVFRLLSFDTVGVYMRLISSCYVLFGKMWKNMENLPFFLGGYGLIGKIQHGRLWPD